METTYIRTSKIPRNCMEFVMLTVWKKKMYNFSLDEMRQEIFNEFGTSYTVETLKKTIRKNRAYFNSFSEEFFSYDVYEDDVKNYLEMYAGLIERKPIKNEKLKKKLFNMKYKFSMLKGYIDSFEKEIKEIEELIVEL